MQNYKEINGNDYVKDSRTTINETMRSIQSMNSGTVFPTTNLFEGMKCYRTDLKKTYTLTDVKNNTWVEDAHAALSDEATHAASATKLQTPRSLNLSGAVTADAANFDGTANATINVKTLDASKLKGTAPVSTTGNAATATKLATARTIALSGNATGSTTFDGSGNATINVTVSESAHAATATQVVATAPVGGGLDVIHAIMGDSDAARVRVYGDANNGALEIATGDDGTEPIYARQYVNSSIDKFTTVARTAAILDTNGNTSFPGTVVAPKFTGALNGNAATASKLLTPRTISLTGKAAGSTSFDGSANAAINVTSVNADTASKLSTARKINITGNATGAASFDGTGDISINTTVNESKHAATADGAIKLDNGQAGSITVNQSGYSDYSPTVGGNYANMNISSWFGVSFTSQCGGSVPKGKTAVGIDCREGIVRAISFEGSLNGTATNADTVDGIHAASLFYDKGNWDANNWATIGTYQVNNNPPVSDAYSWGQVISSSTASSRFQLYASHAYGGDGRLHYRTGWDGDKSQPWNTILDSENYNLFAPTKTGGGASGTWGINISGNAATANVAKTIGKDGGTSGGMQFHWSGQAGQPTWLWGGNDGTNMYVYNPSNFHVATATNADKLDGYHASDLISKIYPVGSIYMSMSATNPASLFGVGTWKRISQGRMLLGADDSGYKAGATGGEAAHTLTVNEMPAHSHGISNSGDHTHFVYGSDDRNGAGYAGDGIDTGGNGHFWDRNNRYTTSSAGAHTHTIDNAGGGAAHNNMPPYLVCYIWQRTA